MPPETQPEVALFSTRGLFQPHLKASIRHAFKAPVRFAPDLIARRDISVGLGCISSLPKSSELLLPPTPDHGSSLEGNGGLSTKSQSET
ncbi:hypothetical protein NKI19_16525 [Mesorhizobium sp. M0751]|uniref:hypothetical protein n=1 Tax=unclassified Mesorhizobium TaxID=325217 RepID=UPI00333AD4AC